MRPYLVEGLDCSGKKTVAALVAADLRARGLDVDVVIGPLARGPLGWVDGRLANITSLVRRRSVLDRLRRSVYVAGPIVDGAYMLTRPGWRAIKVSSHFRAWARARIQKDTWMSAAFAATAPGHVAFGGATLLSARFNVRLARHADDVRAGRTHKIASTRFLGPDEEQFAHWHRELDALVRAHVPSVLRLDSSDAPPAELATLVASHLLSCWGLECSAEAAAGSERPLHRRRERD